MSSHTVVRPSSRSGAFSHTPFVVMWVATTVSLTGLAISDTSSAWLMTTLNPDPRAVSLVQVASSLPMFLCTVPAGALADMVQARRFLITLETLVVLLMGLMGAVHAANSVGYNLSRAVGPAAAGFAIARLGSCSPYWLFAAADLSSIAALVWWRPPKKSDLSLTRRRVLCAVRIGLRHAVKNKHLQATMIRTVAVYPFACAYLALLPLIARHQLTHGPEVYGVLLAVVSVGAVLGSVVLASMQKRLDPNTVVAAGTGGLALALVLFGLAQNIVLAAAAALIAGAAWTMVLSVLYVSAQLALPDWVRGRGLSIFLTVIFGSITLGSAVWGLIAAKVGLEAALFAAAAGALLAIPLSWRWKLKSAEIETSVPPIGAQPVA